MAKFALYSALSKDKTRKFWVCAKWFDSTSNFATQVYQEQFHARGLSFLPLNNNCYVLEIRFNKKPDNDVPHYDMFSIYNVTQGYWVIRDREVVT
jgi:hypothetical protein